MAVFVETAFSINVDAFNLAGYCDTLAVDAAAEGKNYVNFASGGWQLTVPGLMSGMVSVEGTQDLALTGPDVAFPFANIGTLQTFNVQVPGTAVADPAYFGQARQLSTTPLTGPIGEIARYKLGFAGTAQMVRGQVLHPSAARTTTGNGTTTTFTAPTASQGLYAAFNVSAVSGSGTITFVVETDDNSGMTSPTTRLTSAAFAAVGGDFKSLAGALAGETNIRVRWVIAGFTSVTFTVAAGVL